MHNDFEQKRWEGLFRGSVLSSAITKHVTYLTSADTRAQGLILLNSALIPVALSGIQTEILMPAVMLSIFTALMTITLCVFCLYPKRFLSDNGSINILNYVEFSKLKEEDFLNRMRDLFADKEKLAEAAARDLHHLGTKIVGPKYMFLRFAYIVFLVGQLSAVLLAALKMR